MSLAVLVIGMFLLMFLSMPIAFAIGVASLLSFLVEGTIGMTMIPQRMYAALNSWPIMAIPLFMTAGILMDRSGITERLIKFANALIGFVSGSVGMVAVVASMLFAAISGSSTANVAATGSMTIPAMKKQGFDPAFAASVEATASAIGPVIPPSILMIVLGHITETSIARLFLAGLLPGVLVGIGALFIVNSYSRRTGQGAVPDYKFSWSNLLLTAKNAIPGLLMPLIIILGIILGVFTATEAAGVAVVYGIFIAMVFYRTVGIRDLPNILMESAILSSAVMFIVTTAYILGWLITVYRVPYLLGQFLDLYVESPVVFLIIVNVVFILLGMLLESFTAIIVFVPILFPVALDYGIDPVHFGLIVCVNLAVGYITPPYGATLYVASGIAETPVTRTSRFILPFITVMVAVLLLTTYFPRVFLWLPGLI